MDMTPEHLRAILKYCLVNKTCGTKKQEIWCLQNGYVHKVQNGTLELTGKGWDEITWDQVQYDVT